LFEKKEDKATTILKQVQEDKNVTRITFEDYERLMHRLESEN